MCKTIMTLGITVYTRGSVSICPSTPKNVKHLDPNAPAGKPEDFFPSCRGLVGWLVVPPSLGDRHSNPLE